MPRDIDIVIEKVRSKHPAIVVVQLKVAHPKADDAGLWFFRLPPDKKEIQVESSTGSAPFLIEGDADPIRGASVDQTAAEVVSFFGKEEANQPSQPTPPRRRG